MGYKHRIASLRICLVKIFMIKSRDDFHFLTLSEADQFMYPSDLTDAEWKRIAHSFRPKDRCGSACKHEKKRIVDAILYVVKGGIQALGWQVRRA